MTVEAPVLVGTDAAFPCQVSVSRGSGKRLLAAGLGDVATESVHVAITWAAINVPQLCKSVIRRGGRVRTTLLCAKEDIRFISTQVDCLKEGPSSGACVGLSLVCWLTACTLKRKLIGVTGALDLRGRIFSVGGLNEKAQVAQEAGLAMVVVPQEDYDQLKSSDFSLIPEGVRGYAKTTFRGANTMADVLRQAIEGKYRSC